MYLQSVSHCVRSCHCWWSCSSCRSEALSLSLPSAGSDGRRGVGLFGSDPGHVLQLAGVGHVVARLVLGEDFHQRTELQPPLLLRDPVAEETRTRRVGHSHWAESRTENVEDSNTHTKSVSSRSCDTGWNTRALRRIPSRQAVSSELANTRPAWKTSVRLMNAALMEHHQTCSEFTLTSFVRVLERPCDPLNGFSCNFSAKVSIKGWRRSSLWGGEEIL